MYYSRFLPQNNVLINSVCSVSCLSVPLVGYTAAKIKTMILHSELLNVILSAHLFLSYESQWSMCINTTYHPLQCVSVYIVLLKKEKKRKDVSYICEQQCVFKVFSGCSPGVVWCPVWVRSLVLLQRLPCPWVLQLLIKGLDD